MTRKLFNTEPIAAAQMKNHMKRLFSANRISCCSIDNATKKNRMELFEMNFIRFLDTHKNRSCHLLPNCTALRH